MDYAWEKLTQAVDSLTGVEPLQKRLVGAGIALMLLDPEQFHDDGERARWSSIMERLTARQDVANASEGTFAATARTMSDDEARSLAREIRELHGLHVLSLIEGAERNVVVCSSCGIRRHGGTGTESDEERWLVRDAGIGSLTLLCPRCADADG
jgi:hypothetical protein